MTPHANASVTGGDQSLKQNYIRNMFKIFFFISKQFWRITLQVSKESVYKTVTPGSILGSEDGIKVHILISRSQWPTFGIWYLLTVQLIRKIILLGTCSSTVDWCNLHIQLHLYSKVGHMVNFSLFIIYLYFPNFCYLWYVESYD